MKQTILGAEAQSESNWQLSYQVILKIFAWLDEIPGK
jgi:hypothetical protein